jgi:hypothetical protein
MHELEEANRKHALELAEEREGWKKAKEAHTHQLAEMREGWKKKETHMREVNEALSATLRAQLIVSL